ncbi:MAG: glycosyltransferase [Oligoflexia bacterium]|nr:glycosyltransferase [Oligoflexia bacterium]
MPSEAVSKIRIAFVITSLTTGGAERSLVELLSRLDRTRFEFTVICLQHEGDYGRELQSRGIPLNCLRMGGLGSFFRGLSDLRKALRKFAPDIVQCWMYHANFFGTLASFGLDASSLVWNVRNSLIAPGTTPSLTRIVVWISGVLSRLVPMRIIYNSYRAEHIHTNRPLVAFSKRKGQVISNGFDTDQFKASLDARLTVRAELGLNQTQPLVGIFGRSHPVKDHPAFLKAAALISRLLPAARFLMCGAGLDKSNTELNALIKKLGLEGKVVMLGRRDDMPRLMASLDVMVLTSQAESFPRVIGEALSCGIPCVATDVGDCRELIRECGAVVGVGDVEAIAYSVVRILQLSDEERNKMSRSARARIEQSYAMQACTQEYVRLYESLVVGSVDELKDRKVCVG